MKTTTLLQAISAIFSLLAITWVASSTPGPKTPVHSSVGAKSSGPTIATANTVLGLARSALVRPDLPANPNRPFQMTLRIDGSVRTLNLIPYSVRGRNFRILAEQSDGTLKNVPAGPMRTFRGEVTGITGSFVAATRNTDGLHARIQIPGQREHWLEPMGKRIAGAKVGEHVLYSEDDVLEGAGTCAANEAADAPDLIDSGTVSESASASEQIRIAEISCDADYEYFQRWGSVTAVSDRIESIINAVNVQFERDVAISHVVGTIIVRTSNSNPYRSSDPNTLLEQFRSHWQSEQSGIQRDVAHLFTGKDLNGSVIGVAWIGGICSTYFGYGVSQSDFSGNFACVTDLTAHELGHNWGSGHCSCSGYTMNPSIACANQFHPTHTIPLIASFRDTRACLDLGAPTPPDSPTNLEAIAASESEIDLTWTDNSTIEQGFDIDRSEDGGATWAMVASVGANTTSYQDTGLPPVTTFHYRVNAYNNEGDSNFTNVASATTFAPPPPPAAPDGLLAIAQSESRIDLSWADNSSNEDGFEIARFDGGTWTSIGTAAANAASFSDAGLSPSTLYSYQVRAFNSGGTSSYSDPASATTEDPPPFVDQFAQSEIPVSGTVNGTFQNTVSDDGNTQSIRERESGGKRSRRFSFLEHVWQFNVQPGNAITLFANAWSSGSNDGDAFRFEFSTGGTNYSPAINVSATSSGNVQSASLPTSVSGTLFVRVVDTDRTRGNRELDSVYVDHLYVRSDLTPGSPPAAPTNLAASAAAGSVHLDWSDESTDEYGFQIERSDDALTWQQIDTTGADTNSFIDQNVLPSTTYHYRVRAFNGSGASGYSNDAGVTTLEGITLTTADGYKVKGRQRVDLTWTGGLTTTVEIYRNGELIEPTANDGAYTDIIGNKGGGTYEYVICETGGSACSNALTVSF